MLKIILTIVCLLFSIGAGAVETIDPALVAKARANGQRLGTHRDDAERIQISPNGEYVAIFPTRSKLEIYERATGKLIFSQDTEIRLAVFGEHTRNQDALKWSPTGHYFLFRNGQTGKMEIYRTQGAMLIASFGAVKNVRWGNVIFSPDDRRFAVLYKTEFHRGGVYRDLGSVEIYLIDANHALKVGEIDPPRMDGKRRCRYVDDVIFSPDGERVITKSPTGFAAWTLSGKLVREIETSWDNRHTLALLPAEHSPTAPEIMVRKEGKPTQIWNYETGSVVESAEAFGTEGMRYVYDFPSFTPDGQMVIHPQIHWIYWGRGPDAPMVFNQTSTVVYSAKTGQVLKRIAGNKAFAQPDGRHLITWVYADGRQGYAVWTLPKLELVRFYPCQFSVDDRSETWSAAEVGDAEPLRPFLSPDGKKIISAAGCMTNPKNFDVEEVEIDSVFDFGIETLADSVRESGAWMYPYRRNFLNQMADAIAKLPQAKSVANSREAYARVFALELVRIYLGSIDSKTMKEDILPGLDRRLTEYRKAIGSHGISEMTPTPEIRKFALQTIALSLISLQEFATSDVEAATIAKLKTASALAQADPSAVKTLLSELEDSREWLDQVKASSRTSGNALIIDVLRKVLAKGQ